MEGVTYPGGLSELDFVQAYCDSTLRKPQVAADSALRALVNAAAVDRLMLAGLLADQVAEACRRLAAVHGALADRRFPVARSLMGPLPGAAAWRAFAQQAGTFTPEQMLRELSLADSALDAARKLRAQPSLGQLDGLVEAAEAGSAMLVVPPYDTRRVPTEILFAGITREGGSAAVVLGAGEGDAATLADITADLCGIARSFLQAYLGSRRTAGRRD